MKTYTVVAAKVSNDSPGITLTLESTGVFLGILLSVAGLASIAIRMISKMNSISASIALIEKTLKEQSENTERIRDLDKDFALHIQEYVNRKDVVQMVLGQLDEKINHTWSKTEKLYNDQKEDIKEIQQFLRKQGNFTVRHSQSE